MNELKRLLAATSDEPSPAVERLRALLASRAQEQDLLDVAYRTIDSPIGVLLLAATPSGLIRVAFAVEDHEVVLDALAQQVSPRILLAPARLDDAARQLDDYFTSRRRRFDLPLDLRLTRGFRRTVLEHLPEVGYGHTVSYAELAAEVGNPKASRAVGTACATNPLPLVIPCHRVVRSDGTTGAYLGGAEVKRMLLDLEHTPST